VDLLEYQSIRGKSSVSWDVVGWHGGDYQRLWIKSEGRHGATSASEGAVELQLLYGKLVSSYFDAQVGIRVDRHFGQGADVNRAYVVIGMQGLVPYRFEVEPTLFISTKGRVSGRIKASYDVLVTQRLVLQPRFETNLAVQRDEAIGIGAGLNDVQLGARLRYEVRREFAPYFGFTWKQSIGPTHALAVRDSGDLSHFALIAGVRVWF
jgi:copper resistance protein B